jgi:hypothetical protein
MDRADLKSENTRQQQEQKMMRYGQMQIGCRGDSHRPFSSESEQIQTGDQFQDHQKALVSKFCPRYGHAPTKSLGIWQETSLL